MNNTTQKQLLESVLSDITPDGPHTIPQKYQNLVWSVGKKLGEDNFSNAGNNGSVYALNLKKQNCNTTRINLNGIKLNSLYVIKFVPFQKNFARNNHIKNSFFREVEVGMNINIFSVGPRIYGYKVYNYKNSNKEFGVYIMDNIEEGKEVRTNKSLYFFLIAHQNNSIPNIKKRNTIYKKLSILLRNFYKMGYYHGDLHLNNIHVLIDSKNSINVRLIDYGSTQLFQSAGSNLNHNYIENILLKIHQQFHSTSNLTYNNLNQKTQQRILRSNGSLFRSNGHVLATNLSALYFPHDFYRHFLNENKKMINKVCKMDL